MFRPGTETLPCYSIGEEPQWLHKLDANERPGKLPLAVNLEIGRRLRAIATNRYPDMGASRLRTKLAEVYKVPVEQVTVGNGSSELIAAVCAAFGGTGRAIAYQWPSFSMYPIYAALADSPAVSVPLDDNFQLSVETVLQTLWHSGAKLLILCNPNNPTGGVIPIDDLRAIIEQSPCPVLVDEAYMEYYNESCIPWLIALPNLMVTRTFSKAYGLAAARVGYMLASPEISLSITKRLLPYHSNAYSLAMAEVCLSNRDKVMIEAERTIRRRERMIERLSKLRTVQVFPSATNFLLVKVKDPDALHRMFIERGIGVRNFSYVPELKGCLRITVGNPVDTRVACDCIKAYDDSQPREETRKHG